VLTSGRVAPCVADSYADPAKAKEALGWSSELGVKEMCEDTWRWQSANPNGYRGTEN
jgi:UDP-glucose 4-epimerase